jgi:hypothetical protein
MKGIVNAATNDILRYIPSPIEYIPNNETLILDDLRYIPLSKLNNADPIKAYKTYTNLSG